MKAIYSLTEMAQRAKKASFQLFTASTEQKNRALKALMEELKKDQDTILRANREDIELAKAKELSESLIDRLSLQDRLEGIIQDIEHVIQLPDPIGEKFDQQQLPNQLYVEKQRTPIGVLGVIYESRPNVTVDISALSLKSGNCAILRGGSETLQTNQALMESIQKALRATGFSIDAIQLIHSPDRIYVNQLLRLHDYVDLIIPRGNSALQQFCRENSTIPVVTGGIGICHLFVDESANLEHSLQVILNAKTQRPTVCNALDTLLVHSKIAPAFIPKVIQLLGPKGVCFCLDPSAWNLLNEHSYCRQAKKEDWDTEWLSLVLGVKVVQNVFEAMEHICQHSTKHSDGILTENEENATAFIKGVDSAAVYVNASTRFTDGGQLGLGSEVAISTQKLHARGPMGLKELTTYKWVIKGNYQIRH
jgi:glutamate-5-semialdehyde dehydrogenase